MVSMGLLAPIERRQGVSLEDPSVPLAEGVTLRDMILGGTRTRAGVHVNEGKALTYAAVWCAVMQISSAVATLPLKLYARLDNGGKKEENGHPVWSLLTVGPNPEMVSNAWRSSGTLQLLLRGNMVNELRLNGAGDVVEIWPVTKPVRRVVKPSGRTFYEVKGAGGGDPDVILTRDRAMHILGLSPDGYWGYSPVTLARESLGFGLATEAYGAAFFGNGGTPLGFLVHPMSITREGRQRIRESYEETHGGPDNAHKVGVMGEGIKWEQVGLSAEDSQFLQSREFQVREVARWFNIPPHKIRDLEHATFSNVEEENIEYINDTIQPWLNTFEQAINHQILSASDRANGLFAEFNVKGRLKGDAEKRAQFYNSQFQTGAMSPNEIRQAENNNPIEGGDSAFVPLNLVPIEQAGALTVDERAQLLAAENGGDTEVRQLGSGQERRSVLGRQRLVANFSEPLQDAFGRMVRGEIRNVRRGMERNPDQVSFVKFLRQYYRDEHPEFIRSVVDPTLGPLGRAIGDEAANEVDTGLEPPEVEPMVESYLDNFSNRASAASRYELLDIVENQVDYDGSLEERWQLWLDGSESALPRNERHQHQESQQMSNFVARSVFAGMGVTLLRWHAVGKNCPYCDALSGKVVGIEQSFFSAGESFHPEGAASPLLIRRNTFHPPIHKGCDCLITPG